MPAPETSAEVGAADAPAVASAGPVRTRAPLPVLILVAALFVLSLLKGLRMPNLWSATHMTFNYSQGFIRRGLFGQILRLGGRAIYKYDSLALLAAILFVIAWAAIARLVRRALDTDGSDPGAVAMALVFAASPGVVFLAHEIGYLDYIGLAVVPLFILWAARTRRRWAVFYAVVVISVVLTLIHESMIIMFAPTMWLVMAGHIARESRARTLTRRTLALLVGHAALAALLGMVVSSLVGTLGTRSPARIHALHASIARFTNFPLRGDGFEALYRPVRDNLLHLMPRHWSYESNQRYLINGWLASIPGLVVMSVYALRLVGRLAQPRLARVTLSALFLIATFSPQLLNFVGWDAARWNAICYVAAFNCIAALRLFFVAPPLRGHAAAPGAGHDPRRYRVDGPWMLTLAGAAIAIGLTANYPGFLFDGYVVQWFPFDGQLRSLQELIRNHFTFVPGA
ncbi:MAG TPA: hypothetical protein VFH68_18655 [Polyangia bacterium]|jgi:hypothetical protein|nr:hypothetical protein [Polyangia bacterium]